MTGYTNVTLTEQQEQTLLMRWAQMEKNALPGLDMLFHIPNEGKRSQITGKAMKESGMKRGVPDLFLPVAKGQWHGLFIELKREKGSYPSEDQIQWLEALQGKGYAVCWCRGWRSAASAITDYMRTGLVIYTNKGHGKGAKWEAV